ncbi:site-specific integrase [Zhongshania sp.]|uniref:tyrosine-type recombinase/integrase n=1 Tax=Zhongshania sp. TaxID=1971902 RepID=UPI001B704DE4|nr:site-specific integrase [Zhongshania sp.]MBQ0797403.1 site-specific integrase [Zhongshania sp.]
MWETKTETATRVRGRIEKIIDYARARKLRKDENPARWRGHLDALLAKPSKLIKSENYPSLPYQRANAFISALRQRQGISALALEFLILTNTRTGDVLEASWQEIDLDSKLWTIPEHRLKTRKEHLVPLSDRAVEILKTIDNSDPSNLIFISPRGGQLSNMAMLQLIKNMDSDKTPWRADNGRIITPHGFRSTFRTWAGECTAYPRDLIEFAMAHQLKDKAEAAYHRSTLPEKRRKLMQDWSNKLNTHASNAENVKPIRKTRPANT